MSQNNALNGLIAVIEDRPELARTFFRDPNSGILDIGSAMARLYVALDKRTANKLKELLVKTLAAQPGLTPSNQEVYDTGFYDGVREIEKIIENYIGTLV